MFFICTGLWTVIREEGTMDYIQLSSTQSALIEINELMLVVSIIFGEFTYHLHSYWGHTYAAQLMQCQKIIQVRSINPRKLIDKCVPSKNVTGKCPSCETGIIHVTQQKQEN